MHSVGRRNLLLLLGCFLGVACGPLQAAPAIFVDFSDFFSGSSGVSLAYPPIGVSSDGSTVFGQWSPQPRVGHFAFRWRPGELPETLFTDDDTFFDGIALAGIIGVADDGSAFVSHWNSELPNSTEEPFRWTEAGGPEGLGSLSAGYYLTPWTLADSLSGDGRTVIGATNDPPGFSGPFQWTVSDGLQPRNDGRRSLNYDGSVAAGRYEGRAALFTEAGVMPIGPPESVGELITSDGNFVLVRTGDFGGSIRQRFLWSQGDGLVEIEPLAGSVEFDVEDISDDGSTAVGYCDGGCIWRRGIGSMSMEDYFRDELGLSEIVSQIDLGRVYSVSADGRVFVGEGRNLTSGKRTSWVVMLVPEPGTSTLVVASLALLLCSQGKPRSNPSPT